MPVILQWFVLNPIKAIEEERIGCTAQCPFCGTVCVGGVACQNEDQKSQKHRAEIHMPRVIMSTNYGQTPSLTSWLQQNHHYNKQNEPFGLV